MKNNRSVSKSPYDSVKPKISNRSVTVGKHDMKNKKADLYLEKLCMIRDLVKNSGIEGKGDDPITKIREIV